MKLVIVTGMSGAGKTIALKMLEDIGFYCVDNLPISLVDKFVQLVSEGTSIEKAALGLDIRSGEELGNLDEILENWRSSNVDVQVLFLDANDAVLIKRYKETRRTHPLAGAGRLENGIEKEREKLAFLKREADYIIDTSMLLTRELRKELEKIFFTFLPECVKHTLYYKALPEKEIEQAANLAEDAAYIRMQLKELGLVAFVANGSILPRESGVSGKPLKRAVPFVSPKSMEVTLTLPHYGEIKGMGIKKGITLIVGGGYHGKSTLLKALETGVYGHIAGDGREYVITDETAMKIRAEDGRSIRDVDISMFIHDLPNGKDTVSFYTDDASGSTSQAANVVEAMEAGTHTFLIDEDTSATNFMIRDELMQRVVNRDAEPIVPFIDRIGELYHKYGISTILVAGSSGSYFHKADCIIQMNRYEPVEITEFAKEQAKQFPLPEQELKEAESPDFARRVRADKMIKEDNRLKIKTMGRDGISINRETIDVRYVEQLADSEQLATLGYLLKYANCHLFDGKKTLQEVVDALCAVMDEKGMAAICESSYLPCGLAKPRRQEIFACINRYRRLGL